MAWTLKSAKPVCCKRFPGTRPTTTNASTAVTLTSTNPDVRTGMLVTGTGIAANTVVAAVSGTSVTLSANATASGTVTLTFNGYPEVLLKWNPGYHAYDNAVAI